MPPLYIPVPMIGGVNRLVHQRRIGDHELYSCQNLFPDRSGVMSSRPAMVNSETISVGNDLTCVAARRLMYGTNAFLYVYRDSNTPTRVTVAVRDNGATTTQSWTPAVVRVPAIVDWDQGALVFPGVADGVYSGVRVYWDGVNWQLIPFQFAGTQTTRPAPTVACTYRNRVAYAQDRKIFFSDPMDANTVGTDVLSDNARHTQLLEFGSDDVIAMSEVAMTGTDSGMESALLVLGRYHGALLTGEPLYTDMTPDPSSGYAGDLRVNMFNYDIGCESPQTLVRTAYGLVWASHDDVWMFNIGQAPTRVGTKIRPVLRQTAAAYTHLWHAAYLDGVYRLAVLSSGQSSVSDFSPCGEQWWLDMRESPPQGAGDARWYGPMIYNTDNGLAGKEVGTWNIFPETRRDSTPKLFTVNKPSTSVLALCTLDGASNIDTPRSSPLNPNLNYIDYEVKTKEYDFGVPRLEKLYMGVELDLDTSATQTFYADTSYDGGLDADTDSVSVSATSTGQFTHVLIPQGTTAHQGRTIQLTIRATATVLKLAGILMIVYPFGRGPS